MWDVSSITKPHLVKEIFSHIDDIMDIEVVNEKAKIVSIVSKDGLFSVMNCQNATKLFNQQVGCTLYSQVYYADKDQIFVATQLYEIIGFQIIKDKAPERFAVFRGHIAAINKLVRVGNVLISGSQDGELFTWEIPRFEKREQIVKPDGKSTEHDGFITALAVCGRTIASAASDHKIIIYNLKGTKLCKNMVINSAHASYISGLALTENSVISCSHDSTIKIFSLRANKNPYYNPTVAVHTANLEHI